MRSPEEMNGPPREVFPYVVDFCRSIVRDSDPIFLKVESGPGDQPVECITNVRRRIASHGGQVVLGWKIWEWYGVMIEAEFHVLWRSTDGQFHDVTPNAIPFERVLFLPDPSLTYEEKQVDNIRRPIISDPRIVKFISAAEEVFAINNAGDRASKFEIHVTQEEAQTLRSLQMLRAQLVMQIEASFPGRNELCRCGSGKKFKRCCSGS